MYICGEKREEALTEDERFIRSGHSVSLEYIGENARSNEEIIQAINEFEQLIHVMGQKGIEQTVSLDLSHIGLNGDQDKQYEHLISLSASALSYNIDIMISMEESSKTDSILNVYEKAARLFPNVGITIQAHLFRTEKDLTRVLRSPGKIRLVKGAYKEDVSIALSRSPELNESYITFAKAIIDADKKLSIATHDSKLLQALENRQIISIPYTEIEMLYGVNTGVLDELKEKGYKTKRYLTYGQDWFLYFCHRLAEYPESILDVAADLLKQDGEYAR
ncbi:MULTISPECIES: proline dehydrogenase family protein [Bacillus]|uniref:Proline dehydrogenase n=1 Tax=Bacillus capparidis TaxID=1840411 RepID=A0ABS4CW46_9BACI|nr:MULTISPECIES: proline dehydrogenase family protein [Bacillus]MBP1081757.1 proline dehydrogenase [Bacillus capparidis]MED1096408.1 proline dehydrogenase family protein [Bacillus capparidis]